MSEALADARVRAWATLLAVVGAVVAVLLPSLLLSASDAPGSVTVGVLALAFAALVHAGSRFHVHAALTRPPLCRPVDEAAPVLAGRVTDPVHHPLRPRAPGTA